MNLEIKRTTNIPSPSLSANVFLTVVQVEPSPLQTPQRSSVALDSITRSQPTFCKAQQTEPLSIIRNIPLKDAREQSPNVFFFFFHLIKAQIFERTQRLENRSRQNPVALSVSDTKSTKSWKGNRLTKMSPNVTEPEHRGPRQLSTVYLRRISVGDWHFGPEAIGGSGKIMSAKFNEHEPTSR